jgi:hypothetical protein
MKWESPNSFRLWNYDGVELQVATCIGVLSGTHLEHDDVSGGTETRQTPEAGRDHESEAGVLKGEFCAAPMVGKSKSSYDHTKYLIRRC